MSSDRRDGNVREMREGTLNLTSIVEGAEMNRACVIGSLGQGAIEFYFLAKTDIFLLT